MAAEGKVLVATDVMVPGGVDRYVADLARAGGAAGYAVSAVVERSSRSAVAATVEEMALEVHRCCLYHRSHDERRIVDDSRRLFLRVRPDLLHVVCGAPWSCLALREEAAASGIDTVVTEQYVPEGRDLSDRDRHRIAALYGRARRVIFVCEGNRTAMEGLLGCALDGERFCVIPNAVDVVAIAAASPSTRRRQRRAGERRAAGGLEIMLAARLAPQKGVDLLIEALGLLGPEPGMRADLYGEGPERRRLEERCRRLALGDRVRFRGWCHDVVGELAAHDLFVMPSRSEGMPFALLEALASGIPIIATAVAGNVEALDGGRVGRLVPRDDPMALADALAAWRADRRLGFDLAERGQGHAALRHDLRSCMARTIACWSAAGSAEAGRR